MKTSESQLNMHYGECPKKIESREQTIINIYRKYYRRNSIPDKSQYWTICGRCSYQPNQLEPNCEPDQIIKSGLAQTNQIHGVEISEAIYKWNKDSNMDIHWHLGDFYETMVEYANEHEFSPAIVNADMLLMPQNSANYTAKLMQFLSHVNGEIMLVANMVEEHRHLRSTANDFLDRLGKEPCYQFAANRVKWLFNSDYYWYNGTGNTTTKMMTVIMFKEAA